MLQSASLGSFRSFWVPRDKLNSPEMANVIVIKEPCSLCPLVPLVSRQLLKAMTGKQLTLSACDFVRVEGKGWKRFCFEDLTLQKESSKILFANPVIFFWLDLDSRRWVPRG